MALAHNLAHAVLEWHEAGSLEERVRRGICVLWKRPRETEETQEGPSQEGELHAFVRQDNEAHSGATSKGESTPVVDDNSDDESDEEQERDRQDVVDALDPATALQEAFEDAEFLLENQSSQDVQPKLEYVEDTSALQGAASETTMQVDAAPTGEPSAEAPKSEAAEPSGLKANSGNPMFGAQDASADSGASSSKPKLKSSLLAPLREQIVFSEVEKLFLDLDDFDLVKGMSSLSTEDPSMSAPPPLPDLSEIFPDMQPLGLLDVPPVMSSDGKKKSGRGDRDDPNKRAEDTTYMKVLPANEYMLHKATLLGPLQPSKHWDQDHWHDLDDSVIITENDIPPKAVDDSYMCCESLGVPSVSDRSNHICSVVRQWKGLPVLHASNTSSVPEGGFTTPGTPLLSAGEQSQSHSFPEIEGIGAGLVVAGRHVAQAARREVWQQLDPHRRNFQHFA